MMDAPAEVFAPEAGDRLSGVPIDVYHAGPGDSSSGLSLFLDNPRRYKNRGSIQVGRDAELGTLKHTLLGEPELFAEQYAIVPKGMRRDKRTEEYQEVLAKAEDRMLVTQTELDSCQSVVAEVRRHPTFKVLREGAVASYVEESFYWTDPDTGRLCRVRPDILLDMGEAWCILDMKNRRDWAIKNLCKAGEDDHWPMKAAFYSDGVKAVTGKPCDWMAIAVSSSPPYDVRMPVYTSSTFETPYHAGGRKQYVHALHGIAKCERANVFPGYDNDEPIVMEPSRWWLEAIDELPMVQGEEEPF